MLRLKFWIPLCAVTCLVGCGAKDRDELSLHTPPRAASALAATNHLAEPPPDHVMHRPPSTFVDPAKSDSLPLWPPTSASAAPLAPGSTPPAASPPPAPISPAPALEPAAEGSPPAFAPPQFTQPQFTQPQFTQPQFAPALPAVDPPANPAAPDDLNPLRGSTPVPPPQVAAVPVAPALPADNPLRAGSTEIPALPPAAFNQVQTAPAPIGNAASPQGSGMPLLPHAPAEIPGTTPAATVPVLPIPPFPAPAAQQPAETTPNASTAAELAAPETAPAPTPPLTFPKITTPAAPSRLPRVSIHSSAKPSAAAPLAAENPEQSFAPIMLNPSGGSATPITPADIEAFGPPPPGANQPSTPQPRMMTLGTKTDPPAESTSAAPEVVPLPPLPIPAGSPPPAADPPAFVPPALAPAAAPTTEAAPPIAADPPSFAPPMFDPPAAAADPSSAAPAAPESEPAAGASTAQEPEVAMAPPSVPKATSALVPPVVGNEPYDVVRVFYGTDRLPILVNQDYLAWRILRFLPALLLIGLTAIGIGVVWVSRKITWIIGTGALMFFSTLAVWHGVTETLAISEMAENEEPRYSADKSERGRIERGICEVAIPKTHHAGELESPSILRFEREFKPEEHVTLRKTVRLHDDAFYQQLRAQVDSSPDREILVFVHGFNVSFEDAARRTAQMANDLKLQGAPVFYSWPADKYFLLTYGKDETSVGWTAPHLKEFLLDLVHNTDARAINLVAHSMGNRALTTALREIDLQLRDEARLFNQVVLAAPDIDADDFRDNIAPAIQRTAKQVTLYASSHDIALGASRFFHRNARAGDTSRGLVLVPGMVTIDVSNIDGGPWGHSYVGASDPVLRDLHLLLTSLPPERRTWLKMDELDGQTYWAFKPLGMASGPAVIEPR
jgi:esterase/lipase superfamily enzyme